MSVTFVSVRVLQLQNQKYHQNNVVSLIHPERQVMTGDEHFMMRAQRILSLDFWSVCTTLMNSSPVTLLWRK